MENKWINHLQTIQKNKWLNYVLRYCMSILVVIIAFWLYSLMTAWFGPGLPTYILFYPAVIIVALLAGFGPGLLAILLSVIIAGTWILLPHGIFGFENPISLVSVVLFSSMGVLISTTAELYRRNLKKAQGSIETERQRLIDVMEILPGYLVLLTPDYHIAFANRFFRERFGAHRGKCCYEYLFGLDEPCENCETYKVLKTGAPHHWEWTGPDGRNYDIHDFSFKDTDGSSLIMEFGIDITERKKAENQLIETISELERSNQELQSFAYITSHDLQEPLRTMGSYAGLLKHRYSGQLDEDADDFLEFLESGAARMKEMVQGLLDYSRVGTQGKEFNEFNAEDALNRALTNLKSSIEECHAEVTYGPLPNIIADGNQIQRVFQNLIGNALKFRKGEVQPKIHVAAQKEDKKYVFSVSDNGIGMEEQYTDRIFEVFKRLHPIGKYQGAGIGLAIVNKIIEHHNGRVWVESKLGVGSTFYFTIPIKE